MRAAPPFIFGIFAMMASISHLAADPLPQTQVSLTQGSSNTWNADWVGVTGRTYFVQVSTDLVSWSFAPSVDFGSGLKSLGVDSGGVPKFFLRLKFADVPWVASLQQARDADLDGDGIPNWYEVETIGTDPFSKTSAGGDSDSDGLADGWEMFYFNNLTAAGSGNPDGDSLTNAYEAALGSNPNAGLQTVTTPELQLFIPNEP